MSGGMIGAGGPGDGIPAGNDAFTDPDKTSQAK
jgi:hypothetical protein